MDNELELIVVELITHAGDARSTAIQAIRAARKGDFAEADSLMEQCNESLAGTHESQTKLIFAEANGEALPVSILMVHAQDHVMNAITVKDMAVEMIEILRMQKEG